MEEGKYIRITFSNDACYDLPVEEIYTHYAKHVIKQTEIIDTKPAERKAHKHFDENPDDLLEYVSSAMSWDEVVLDAIAIRKSSLLNKHAEWTKAKKEILFR